MYITYRIMETNGYYEISRWNKEVNKFVPITFKRTYAEAEAWIERREALRLTRSK